MVSARMMVKDDAKFILEGDFASVDANGAGTITLIDPDGAKYEGIKGRIDYDYAKLDSDGQSVLVHEPVIQVALLSLTRVPKAGENWFVLMPVAPDVGASIETFKLGASRAPEAGETIGFIRLYPQRVIQS